MENTLFTGLSRLMGAKREFASHTAFDLIVRVSQAVAGPIGRLALEIPATVFATRSGKNSSSSLPILEYR